MRTTQVDPPSIPNFTMLPPDVQTPMHILQLKFFKDCQNYFRKKNWFYHIKVHGKNNILTQMTIYIEIEKKE